MVPVNPAAQLIVQAHSVLNDLMTQQTEIQKAIDRQQTMIDQLMPVAIWEEPEEPESSDTGDSESPDSE